MKIHITGESSHQDLNINEKSETSEDISDEDISIAELKSHISIT
jgi:hypothetical protein